jgi:hypothetical protein
VFCNEGTVAGMGCKTFACALDIMSLRVRLTAKSLILLEKVLHVVIRRQKKLCWTFIIQFIIPALPKIPVDYY